MLKRMKRVGAGNLNRLSMVFNSEGDGGGGGDGGEMTPEKIQAQIDAAVQAATKGLKAKNEELLGKVKTANDQLKAWDGLDATKVRQVLDVFDKNEELKLIAEGKHDEVIGKRIERERAKFQSQIDELSTRETAIKTENEQLKNRVRDLMIDTVVVNAFRQEQGLETAVPDVVLRAKSLFHVEGDEVIARDSKGEIIRGRDGPLKISEWIAGLKKDAAHLFPGSQGAGGQGGRGGQGGAVPTDIELKMEAAAKAGNMPEYRRLRDIKNGKAK